MLFPFNYVSAKHLEHIHILLLCFSLSFGDFFAEMKLNDFYWVFGNFCRYSAIQKLILNLLGITIANIEFDFLISIGKKNILSPLRVYVAI